MTNPLVRSSIGERVRAVTLAGQGVGEARR